MMALAQNARTFTSSPDPRRLMSVTARWQPRRRSSACAAPSSPGTRLHQPDQVCRRTDPLLSRSSRSSERSSTPQVSWFTPPTTSHRRVRMLPSCVQFILRVRDRAEACWNE